MPRKGFVVGPAVGNQFSMLSVLESRENSVSNCERDLDHGGLDAFASYILPIDYVCQIEPLLIRSCSNSYSICMEIEKLPADSMY